MEFDLAAFNKQLTSALELFDKQAVNDQCDQFIHYLYDSPEPVPAGTLEHLLQILRDKRMFIPMQKLGDCFLTLGLQTYKIRRQYAQSLLDQGIYAAPLAILQEIRSQTNTDPSAADEYAEAAGLIGRIYKQQYVNAASPQDPQSAWTQNPRLTRLLLQAIQSYQEAYLSSPAVYGWHGVNLVALLHRAQADHIGQPGLPDPAPIAKEILSRIETLTLEHKAAAWDFVTACEACIALERQEEALSWLDKYINCSAADAFEIASTLRQFQEVWRLTMDTSLGQQLISLLSAALLRREGAALTISTSDLEKHKSSAAANSKAFEQTLSGDSFRTYQWYVKGLKACSAVARIGVDTSMAKGTGFLLDGALLAEEHRGKTVLLTNAHVISNDSIKNNGSLYYHQAVATLETVDKDLELKFAGIIRTSPFFELDTTVLLLDDDTQKKLEPLKDRIYPYTLAGTLPAADGKQRVYIIGHPRGGVLQISLQDNIFLSCNDQRMHYRTPTAPGSSGSPVFNEDWEIIGIHHAGGNSMPRLDDPRQLEIANEGIRIDAIKTLFT